MVHDGFKFFGWKTRDWLRDNGKAKKVTWMEIRRIILYGNTQSHGGVPRRPCAVHVCAN